jgi:flavin-dependent dehydrogenase
MKRLICLLLPGLLAAGAPARDVVEPAESIPVVQDVDVVVVGGGAGGVEAALAAAKSGAKVFLVAPRPYLGEDICATYRLWLEPGEVATTALAKELFKATPGLGPSLPFSYTADRASAAKHKDTTPPSILNDGKWQNSLHQSVQYDGGVTLTLDLGKVLPLTKITALIFQRLDDFAIEKIAVSASSDGRQWQAVTTITNDKLGEGTAEDEALPLSATVQLQARYLQLAVQKTELATRVLLGEVIVEGAAAPEPPPPVNRPQPVTPMQVKLALDHALLQAHIPFLYASGVTEVLRDAAGQPAGVIIANRSGQQAVRAKVIIDATDRANVARLAGAQFAPYPSETQLFRRTVVGGPVRESELTKVVTRATPLTITDRKGTVYPIHEYDIPVSMADGDWNAFATAEQMTRDVTWTKEAVDASEMLFQVPPDAVRGQQSVPGAWQGADQLPLDALRPAGVARLFVLGGCADVSREAAAQLTRPVNLMAVGARLGVAAAELAQQTQLAGVKVAGTTPAEAAPGAAQFVGAAVNPRTAHAAQVPAEAHGLPVLGTYDVVVVGGGTGGAPAAIGAGRRGAKTLLVEYLHGLGGVGTLGYINVYWFGNRVGFTKEIDAGTALLAGSDQPDAKSWDPEARSEWYRRELRKAGVDVWFGTLGVGAVVEHGRVTGVIVATPHGRGVVLCNMVVDSTGNADIAAAAGAPCRYVGAEELAVQGTGLPPRNLGQKYTNTDYTYVDDTDVFDIWRALVAGRERFKTAYDLGQLIDSRERRQIVGDFSLSPLDIMLDRTFPDTVEIAKSNFDTHGYIVHPVFMLRPPHKKVLSIQIPYRCLLPRGLDGILVTGLGVSAHRDALPFIRVEADIQNQGYAAGVAAAMIAKAGCTAREIDMPALQKHLVETGNLPQSVIGGQDNFPLPAGQVAQAVTAVTKDYDQLEVLLAQFEVALPLLRAALANSTDEKQRLTYASILGIMGDAAGAGTLAQAVAATSQWDAGWQFRGMGQFGFSVSPLDAQLIALARTQDKVALAPILAKAALLTGTKTNEFSHFRAIVLACETLGDPAAAPALVRLITLPGVMGHAMTNITAAIANTPGKGSQDALREMELRELFLARALYRCGDSDGLGEKILKQYAQDFHGHYARHAQAVLAAPKAARP